MPRPPAADLARPPRLVRPRARAVGAAHRVHDARRDRHRLGAAALGAAAGALSVDVRARVPERCCCRCGCCCRLHLAAVIFALLELAQTKHDKWFADQRRRRRRVLPCRACRPSHALPGAAARPLSHRVLSVDVARRRAGRTVLGADCAARSSRRCSSIRCSSRCRMACRPGVFGQPRSGARRELVVDLSRIVAAGLLLIALGAAGSPPTLGCTFGDWGTTPVHRARVRRRHRRLLGPSAARQLAAALMMFAAVVMLPSARQARRRRSAATSASIASASRKTATSTC